MSKRLQSALHLFACIMLCETVGICSALLSMPDDGSWFASLNKPSWNPPSSIFAPVWTILYASMGISLWLVLTAVEYYNDYHRKAVALFGTQLVLNFCWSIIFFRIRSINGALVNIILLDIAVIATMVVFFKINKAATWVLVPYLLWICFASFLNYTILMLN